MRDVKLSDSKPSDGADTLAGAKINNLPRYYGLDILEIIRLMMIKKKKQTVHVFLYLPMKIHNMIYGDGTWCQFKKSIINDKFCIKISVS